MSTESSAYQDGIVSAWQGEQWGREFFERLAEATEDPGHRAKWQVLAELESATGDCLAPLVAEGARRAVRERPPLEEGVAAFAQLSFTDALQQMVTLVDPAIEKFQALLALAPAADRATVQILLDHEIALKQFAEREQAGDSEASLEPVRAVIARARDTQVAA